MDQLEHLAKTVSLMTEGRLDEARQMAQNRCEPADQLFDPAFHLRWAEIYDRLDLDGPLRAELDKVRCLKPDDPEVLVRLSELYDDSGQPERSRKLIEEALHRSPGIPAFYRELAKRTDDPTKAEAILTRGYELTGDEGLRRCAGRLVVPTVEDENPVRDYPSDSQMVRFLDLFAGREGVYARQWSSPTGACGYNPIREQLSVAVGRNHVLGNYTLGIYQLSLANMIKWLAFDVDLCKSELIRVQRSASSLDLALRTCLSTAKQLIDILAQHDLNAVLEFSGLKGYHVWILLEEWIPATLGRRLVEAVAASVAKEPACNIDLFPQQTQVRKDGLGNLIKLPLGIHRRSGRRAIFVDPDGRELPNQLALLAGFPRNQVSAIAPALRGLTKIHAYASPIVAIEPESEAEADAELEETRTPLEVTEQNAPFTPDLPLKSAPYDLFSDDAAMVVLSGCDQLRRIVAKIMNREQPNHDELVVLRHSLGYLPKGKETVNFLIHRCPSSDNNDLIANPLRATPISCRRIRERLKQDCACRFTIRSHAYDNPLLHRDQCQALPKASDTVPLNICARTFEAVVGDYLETRKGVAELRKRIDTMERYFDQIFESGAERIDTSFGTLVRVEQDGKVNYRLELE